MALISRKSPEEKVALAAAKAADRERQAQEQAEERRLRAIEDNKRAFFRTPAGLARVAFDRGDHVFQYAIDVMSQKAIIVGMVGSRTSKQTTDPVEILNSVCREGWELLNGSFVFEQEGQQSRDKLMSSGQNVAIKGTTMGFYLFKRCDANATERVEPWEQAAETPTTVVGVQLPT